MRQGEYKFALKPETSSSPFNIEGTAGAIIDILYHIKPLTEILLRSDPLELIGTENDRKAFFELKTLFAVLDNAAKGAVINTTPFLKALGVCNSMDYLNSKSHISMLNFWNDVVRLILVVIPPLREIFLGSIAPAQEVPGWLNLVSEAQRCFHIINNRESLEDVFRECLSATAALDTMGLAELHDEVTAHGGAASATTGTAASASAGTITGADQVRNKNALILRRSPAVLAITCSPSSPTTLKYPIEFDLASFSSEAIQVSTQPAAPVGSTVAAAGTAPASPAPLAGYYLAGAFYSKEVLTPHVVEETGHKYFFRVMDKDTLAAAGGGESWYCCSCGSDGSKRMSPPVSSCTAQLQEPHGLLEANNPCFLVYVRKDVVSITDRISLLVSKAGQMRAIGDVAFQLAMTTQNYSEARRCYEEAIILDPSLKPQLQDNFNALEKIEKTNRARLLEEQADLALANRRFREASDLYSRAMMSAVVGSGVYLWAREKLEYVTRIISLDVACQYVEKGTDALTAGNLISAKEYFSQAFKFNPELIHLQSVMLGLEKALQNHFANQKLAETTAALKCRKYRSAQQIMLEAIQQYPEKLGCYKDLLGGLEPFIQVEEAARQHKVALQLAGDKKHSGAIAAFSEAIELMPSKEMVASLGVGKDGEQLFNVAYQSGWTDDLSELYCNRASSYHELKQYPEAITNCEQALAVKPESALANFRLGTIYFALDRYEEAGQSYDKALQCDPGIAESVKVKNKQLATAREIQLRKERELQKQRDREEERTLLDARKAKEELAKKDRQEKMERDRVEKVERDRRKAEEKAQKAISDKEKEKNKEAEKEKARAEKAAREAEKQADRERARQEKEKERERARHEKELRLKAKKEAEAEALEKQRQASEELQKAENRRKELEREKELEKERQRLEMERIIAEREKQRSEKLLRQQQEQGAQGPGGDGKKDARATAEQKRQKKQELKQLSQTLLQPSAPPPPTISPVPVVSPVAAPVAAPAVFQPTPTLPPTREGVESGLAPLGMDPGEDVNAVAQLVSSLPVGIENSRTYQGMGRPASDIDLSSVELNVLMGAESDPSLSLGLGAGLGAGLGSSLGLGLGDDGGFDITAQVPEDHRDVSLKYPSLDMSAPVFVPNSLKASGSGVFNSALLGAGASAGANQAATGRALSNPSVTSTLISQLQAMPSATCEQCNEFIDGTNRLSAYGQCNHRFHCSICMLSRRVLAKNTACPTCSQACEVMVCTSARSAPPFATINTQANADLFFDRRSKMYFPKDYYHNKIVYLSVYTCPVCSYQDVNADSYQHHIFNLHSLGICQNCVLNKPIFPAYQIAYPLDRLREHMLECVHSNDDGDLDGMGLGRRKKPAFDASSPKFEEEFPTLGGPPASASATASAVKPPKPPTSAPVSATQTPQLSRTQQQSQSQSLMQSPSPAQENQSLSGSLFHTSSPLQVPVSPPQFGDLGEGMGLGMDRAADGSMFGSGSLNKPQGQSQDRPTESSMFASMFANSGGSGISDFGSLHNVTYGESGGGDGGISSFLGGLLNESGGSGSGGMNAGDSGSLLSGLGGGGGGDAGLGNALSSILRADSEGDDGSGHAGGSAGDGKSTSLAGSLLMDSFSQQSSKPIDGESPSFMSDMLSQQQQQAGGELGGMGLGMGMGMGLGGGTGLSMGMSGGVGNVMTGRTTPLFHTADLAADRLPANAFPSVAWLAPHGLEMFRWSGGFSEWTEFSMHVPVAYYGILIGQQTPGAGGGNLFGGDGAGKGSSEVAQGLQRRSGCKVATETLLVPCSKPGEPSVPGSGIIKECYFLVFYRGASGAAAMNAALELISQRMAAVLPGSGANTGSGVLGEGLIGGSGLGGSGSLNMYASGAAGTNSSTNSSAMSYLADMLSNPDSAQRFTSGGLGMGPDGSVGSGQSGGDMFGGYSGLGSSGLGGGVLGGNTAPTPPTPLARSPSPAASPSPEAMTALAAAVRKGATATSSASTTPSSTPQKAAPAAPTIKPVQLANGLVQRALEIPRDAMGLVIGQNGKKIKELSSQSGCRMQFRVNKVAEKEGRPGVLEITGSADQVQAGIAALVELVRGLTYVLVEVSATK